MEWRSPYHEICCAVFGLAAACRPVAAPQPANRPPVALEQPPPVAPADTRPPPPVAPADTRPPPQQALPLGGDPPAVEELFSDRVQPHFRLDPLGSFAAIRDGDQILAVVQGDHSEAPELSDPTAILEKAYPLQPSSEEGTLWGVDSYVGQWPNDLWVVAANAYGTKALAHWTAGAWLPVLAYSDVIWVGLTAQRHALVLLSQFRECMASESQTQPLVCPHGITAFQAFDAAGKAAPDAPTLPPELGAASWQLRPDVVALPSGEIVLARQSGTDLPRKHQQLVVRWATPKARGAVEWLGEPHSEFLGTLTAQTTGALHIVGDFADGFRRDGKTWKRWSKVPDTGRILADSTLWTITRSGELWCSSNGDEWTEVPLALPAAEQPVTVVDLWRGTSTTLYVLAHIGTADHLFRVRHVTQCQIVRQL